MSPSILHIYRNPHTAFPTTLFPLPSLPNPDSYLMLGSDEEANWRSVALFSARDADNLPLYESFLGQIRDLVEPLLDAAPPNPFAGSWRDRRKALATLRTLVRAWGL